MVSLSIYISVIRIYSHVVPYKKLYQYESLVDGTVTVLQRGIRKIAIVVVAAAACCPFSWCRLGRSYQRSPSITLWTTTRFLVEE
jgi:hypothetical protein